MFVPCSTCGAASQPPARSCSRGRSACALCARGASPAPPPSGQPRLLPALALTVAAAFSAALLWPPPGGLDDTSSLPVHVVIPALNEEAGIQHTLDSLRCLSPPPASITVAVADSSDATAALAKRAGARVVAGTRGRGAQQNAGAAASLPRHAAAAAARADSALTAAAPPPAAALLFVHADTRLPFDAVSLVRAALQRRCVVGGGFIALIEAGRSTFWFATAHNAAKSFYAPALFRPPSFARGFRLLFGDQAIFVRADRFFAVGGFDSSVSIMEDADLCLKLHIAGPAQPRADVGASASRAASPSAASAPPATVTHSRVSSPLSSTLSSGVDTTPGRFRRCGAWSSPRGHLVQINRCVGTDGRRFVEWGSAKATAIHWTIGLSWLAGATGTQMRDIYDRLYGDIRAPVASAGGATG